ncbi:MAG: hypothetical protein ACKOZT_05455, partial [Cyanobium sp.]
SPAVSLPLAHLTATGLGPWGDGMARLLLEPSELLLVIGLVLLGVQARGAASQRLPLLLPLAWLLGGLIGLQLPTPLLLAAVGMALLVVLGLLVALALPLRPVLLLPLSAGLAAFFALVAGSTIAGHAGALPALLGECIAIAVLTTLLAQTLAPPPSSLAGDRSAGGWQLDQRRLAADARLDGAPAWLSLPGLGWHPGQGATAASTRKPPAAAGGRVFMARSSAPHRDQAISTPPSR